jgi:hypothetical protein
MWKVDPLPSVDSTQVRGSPCISTICLAMVGPRPVPPLAHFSAVISNEGTLPEGVTTISYRQFVALCSTAQPHAMHQDIRRLWVEIATCSVRNSECSEPDQKS